MLAVVEALLLTGRLPTLEDDLFCSKIAEPLFGGVDGLLELSLLGGVPGLLPELVTGDRGGVPGLLTSHAALLERLLSATGLFLSLASCSSALFCPAAPPTVRGVRFGLFPSVVLKERPK